MEVEAAQREVRRVYAGGFPGLVISGSVWLVAAALGTWLSWQAAMWALVVGGASVFFLLELLLRTVGHDPGLDRDNPLSGLTLQLAFLLPLLLPLILAAFQHRDDWLFPAFMIALGAHFLPFMFLFGMWEFGALGMVMALSGVVFGFVPGESFVVAGWYGAAVQLLFGFIALGVVRREQGSAS